MQERIVHQSGSLETTGKSIKGKMLNRDQSTCSAARFTRNNVHTHTHTNHTPQSGSESHISTKTQALSTRWQFPCTCIYEYSTRKRGRKSKGKRLTRRVTGRIKHRCVSALHAQPQRGRWDGEHVWLWDIRYSDCRQKQWPLSSSVCASLCK